MKPIKSLGQNFLVDENIVPLIIDAAKLTSNSCVVEIGPGKGVLTKPLAAVVPDGLVLAVELDQRLVELLREKINNKNVKIVHSDALSFVNSLMLPDSIQFQGKIFEKFTVVSNLPYNISSPTIHLIGDLMEVGRCNRAVLMVQKEVAEKLTAKPGDRKRTKQTVLLDAVAQTSIIANLGPEAFTPSPKVDSSVIVIEPHKLQAHQVASSSSKFKGLSMIVKAGFSSKRRQLHNSLKGSLHLDQSQVDDILEKAEISRDLRAEDLSLDQWNKLTTIYEREISK